MMFGMLKMLPLIILLAGAGWGYHTVTLGKAEKAIAQLESNNVILKTNQMQMEQALETEKKSRERAENNLQNQLKAVGELTEKSNQLKKERDEYLGIFKRHDMTRLARVKPGLIEPRINKGTAQVFRSIETDSKEIENADIN
jgi:hypothetical protein